MFFIKVNDSECNKKTNRNCFPSPPSVLIGSNPYQMEHKEKYLRLVYILVVEEQTD